MRRIIFFILAILAIFSIVGCAKSSKKFKVGFVYVGSINDGGWTQSHNEARLELEKSIAEIETTYVENVPEGLDAERVITTFAKKGYDLIYTTSFGFMDPTINVAKKFPNTIFMHCSGNKRANNVGTYFGAMEEAKYLAGLIAGKMTKSNSIGFVLPHPIPEVVRLTNAFAIGVKEVNPDAKVKIVFTNSWFDPTKEKEAAIALIDSGVDVLATGCDSSAAILAGEEREVWTIGYDSDASAIAPKTYLTSPIWNWIVIYKDIVDKAISKEITNWSNFDYYEGLNTGIVGLAPLTNNVPDDVKELVYQRKNDIENKEFVIFKGPLYKNDNTLILDEGQSASHDELMSMDYFIDNIEGSLE